MAPLHLLDLARSSITGKYPTGGAPEKASCVVALSFGNAAGPSGGLVPGAANEALAGFIVRNYAEKPVIAQKEVALAIQDLGRADQLVKVIGPEVAMKDGYLDTRQVLVEAESSMQDLRLPDAVLVAHPHHVARAASVAEALGMEIAVPQDLPRVWDHESQQSWTRSPGRWVVRDVLTILWFRVRGWLNDGARRNPV